MLPVPANILHVRAATPDDLPFIDGLQKRHGKALGFMHRATLEGKIAAGHVLMAEDAGDEARPSGSAIGGADIADPLGQPSRSAIALPHGRASLRTPLGYLIGNDRYYKRDDLGAIFQLCVDPTARRGLVGAALVKALFERSAYGCRLYCCWCAKELDANRFWEAMGFVPIAYRAGSRGKRRIHVFWQKRVRAGDDYPYWYPSKTAGGALSEDRIVLPIPPGVHWSELEKAPLPEGMVLDTTQKALPKPRRKARAKTPALPSPPPASDISSGGLRFRPGPEEARSQEPGASPTPEPEPRAKPRHDPKLEAFARELRDRWQERVAEEPWMLEAQGRYDVCRAIAGHAETETPRLLAA